MEHIETLINTIDNLLAREGKISASFALDPITALDDLKKKIPTQDLEIECRNDLKKLIKIYEGVNSEENAIALKNALQKFLNFYLDRDNLLYRYESELEKAVDSYCESLKGTYSIFDLNALDIFMDDFTDIYFKNVTYDLKESSLIAEKTNSLSLKFRSRLGLNYKNI